MSFQIFHEKLLYRYREDEPLKKVIIPDGITILRRQSFFRVNDMEVVIIPESVQIIEDKAFHYCYSLREVHITQGIETISEYAFQDCTQLEKLCWKSFSFSVPAGGHSKTYLPVMMKAIAQKNLRSSLPKYLKYPLNLALYQNYPDDEKVSQRFKKAMSPMCEFLIDTKQTENLQQLLALIPESAIDSLIRYAIDRKNYTAQLLLTDYKYQHFPFQDIPKKFKL